jgi:CrcB protein
MRNILLVGVGGMLGSVLRYLASVWMKPVGFPIATLSVNILGSLLIGLIMGWAARQPQQEVWRLLLATGVCGGFTTFSAFAWENLQMLQQQRYLNFGFYAGSSLILSLIAVAAGYWLSK